MSWKSIALGALGTGIVLVGIGAAIDKHAPVRLPGCQDEAFREEIAETLADSPGGHLAHLQVTSWLSVKTVSVSPTEVKCSAQVTLNDTSKVDITYRGYMEQTVDGPQPMDEVHVVSAPGEDSDKDDSE